MLIVLSNWFVLFRWQRCWLKIQSSYRWL